MDKRGQLKGFAGVVIGIIILIVVIIGISSLVKWGGKGDYVSSLKSAIDGFGDIVINVIGPILGAILNLPDADSNTSLLMILTFILVSTIIITALDSVNIFGDDRQGIVINSIIGIIVAIIGIRFMPKDIWGALTSPSSAFVATLLVGAPFAAFFFVTMKIKFPLANKLIWLFYIIFMSYLIFFPSTGFSLSNSFMWIYTVFLILAGVMMFFDSTVRAYFFTEKEKAKLGRAVSDVEIQERIKARARIKELTRLKAEANDEETKDLNKQIDQERKKLREFTSGA